MLVFDIHSTMKELKQRLEVRDAALCFLDVTFRGVQNSSSHSLNCFVSKESNNEKQAFIPPRQGICLFLRFSEASGSWNAPVNLLSGQQEGLLPGFLFLLFFFFSSPHPRSPLSILLLWSIHVYFYALGGKLKPFGCMRYPQFIRTVLHLWWGKAASIWSARAVKLGNVLFIFNLGWSYV